MRPGMKSFRRKFVVASCIALLFIAYKVSLNSQKDRKLTHSKDLKVPTDTSRRVYPQIESLVDANKPMDKEAADIHKPFDSVVTENMDNSKPMNRDANKNISAVIEDIHVAADNVVNGSIYKLADGKVNREAPMSSVHTTNAVNSFCNVHPGMVSANVQTRGVYYRKGPLYYCDIPKLGSTFLKAFFRETLQDAGSSQYKYIQTQYSKKNVFSFLNVGDPYSRLFSAYKNKLFKPDVEFWSKIGRDVVETVRINKTKYHSGFDVTFKEIVQFVTNYNDNGKTLEQHLEPIHKLCNPCKTRFDFIGKMETMFNDLVDLFDTLNNTGIVKDDIPVSRIEKTVRYRQRLSIGSVNKLFNAVKKMPNVSAYHLFLQHWSTYHMGGIILNQYELPFNVSEIETISREQYTDALLKAEDDSKDNNEQLRLQRREALVQAYRSVPLPLMSRLRDFVKIDCMLFSYDDKPDFLFDRQIFNDSITHIYMKGI